MCVTNEDGEPLSNASITLKGASTGVTSSDNGTFEINAPTKGTLFISLVGFIKTEVSINNKSSLSVSLKSTSGVLDQVVVVGYGTQKRSSLTGAVSTVSSKTLNELPVPSID